MEKARLETFTDGVFAIVVTLLVLGIHLPLGTTTSTLGSNLIHILPFFGAYALSVIIVGIYWVSHHLASTQFKKIDTRVMWLNIVLILFVGLIPFTTGVLSEFMFSPWAIVIYGANILAMNFSGWLIMSYLYSHKNLSIGDYTEKLFKAQRHQYIKIALLYAVGIVFAFINPDISVFLYALVTIYIVLGTLVERLSWRAKVN